MSPGLGPKPSEYAAWPPTVTVKNVRPWKPLLNAMICDFSAPNLSSAKRRANLSAASFASAPELAK